jgi:hypothetical protein
MSLEQDQMRQNLLFLTSTPYLGIFFIGLVPDLDSSLKLYGERTIVQHFFNLAANGLKKDIMNFKRV